MANGCDCLTITILNPPKFNNLWNTNDLDLYSEISITEENEIFELDNLNNIQTEFITSFTIPITDKNRFLLGDILSINNVTNRNSLRVSVKNFGRELNYHVLRSTQYIEDTQSLEIELVADINMWATALQNTKLSDCELGTIENHSRNDIEIQFNDATNWGLYQQTTGTKEPYLYFPVNYTKNKEKMNWETYEMRPFLSVLNVLRAVCCEAGYEFKSPVFDDDNSLLRRWWAYLLKKDFYIYPNKGRNINIYATNYDEYLVEWAIILTGEKSLIFNSTQFAPFYNTVYNSWDNTNNWYINYFNDKIKIKVDISFSIKERLVTVGYDGPYHFYIDWIVKDNTLNIYTSVHKTYFTMLDGADVNRIITDSFECYIPANGLIYNKFEKDLQYGDLDTDNILGLRINPNNTIKITAVDKGISAFDSVELKDLVRTDITGLDIIKGVAHLMKGKIIVDEANKILYLHKSFSGTTFEEMSYDVEPNFTEGFYNNKKQIDNSNTLICSSSVQTPKANSYRNLILRFKEVSDAFFDDNDKIMLPEILHGRTIEIDPNASDDLEIANPLFAPTYNRYSYDPNDPYYNSKTQIDVPVIYENDGEDGMCFDITPRILFAVGLVDEEVPKMWTFSGNPWYVTPFACQYSFTKYQTFEARINAKLVFGGWAGDYESLCTEFWRDAIGRIKAGSSLISIKATMDVNRNLIYDFYRYRYFMDIEGIKQMYAPISQSYDICKNTLDMELVPYIEYSNDCTCFKPCDCHWRQCEFYVDLNSTVIFDDPEDWAVSSFKIGGNEQLTAPVNFGSEWNTHLISGITYVENFVDTMNSIVAAKDIPMEFTYSDRILFDRAKWLFIKYPFCQNIEIIVTKNGVNVFKISIKVINVYSEWNGTAWVTPPINGATEYSDTYADFSPRNCTMGIW